MCKFWRRFRASGQIIAATAMIAAFPHASWSKDIKVGFFGPLSGAAAVYGTDTLAGAQFALEEINKSNLLGGDKIKLIVADTGANPGAAAQAAQRMIDADDVIALIGGSTSAESAAAIEVTREAQVLQISPLAQDAALTEKNNKWFARVAQSAKTFGANAAKWLIEQKKAKNIYILVRNDNGNQSVADAFEAAMKELGSTLVGRATYEPSVIDFKPMLAKLKDAKPDFIAIFGLYTDTGLVLKQIGELQIALPVYANTSPGVPQFREIAGSAAEGAYGGIYYLAGSINNERGKAFLTNWQAKYSQAPGPYVAMGYDTAHVLAEAIARSKKAGRLTREGVRDGVFSIKDFPGGSGPITILPNGDGQRPLPFVQIEGAGLKLDYLME